jgi:hypothetical protein
MKKLRFYCKPSVLADHFSYNEKSDIDFEVQLNSLAFSPCYIITFKHDDDALAFKIKFQEAEEIKPYDAVHDQIIIQKTAERALIPSWYKRLAMRIKNIFK